VGDPARRPPNAGFPISEVARRTGVPPSTLRFYEREMPGLFLIRKTPGGHRRYTEEDVERFTAIRRLTHSESLPLSEVRRVLASRGDHEPLREEVARLRAARQEDGWTISELGRRIATLEQRLDAISGGPRRSWFRKK
jgi:MerR family transcriptional regulator/heat shock protein HspR